MVQRVWTVFGSTILCAQWSCGADQGGVVGQSSVGDRYAETVTERVAASSGDLDDTSTDAGSYDSGLTERPKETNGTAGYVPDLGGETIQPLPPENGPVPVGPTSSAPLTPEEAQAQGLAPPQPDVSTSDGETEPSNGASEPVRGYESCSECREEMCGGAWGVCQAAPQCRSANGCIAECGASASSECVLACFDGDTELALVAFQLHACSTVQCSVECS